MAAPRIAKVVSVLTVVSLANWPVHARYNECTGEPNEPSRIAAAEGLMLLGETPEDYEKHLSLTAGIDRMALIDQEMRS